MMQNNTLFSPEIRKLDKRFGSKYPMVDCHVHAVNFQQKTPGLAKLIEYMDETQLLAAVVFGLPVIKQHASYERETPTYYLDDDAPAYYFSHTDDIIAREFLSLSSVDQARIFPTMCGFNPNDCASIEYIKQLYKLYPQVFCGIGEIFARHDDLTLLTEGEISRMNNPSLHPILEFISDYQLPLLVHSNVTTPWVHDYPKFLHELEQALRNFPKAPIVFCHCGISRRVYSPFYHRMIERLLSLYPSLYVDFSWIVFDEIICPNGIPSPEWIELSERFSKKIFLGSDVVGSFHKMGVINSRFDPFLQALTEEARENICFKNAYRLYGNNRGRVEAGIAARSPEFSLLDGIL